MNLLITGAWAEAEAQIPALEAMGCCVVFQQYESAPLACDPAWVEGIVCSRLFVHHAIEPFSNLRYLQLTSAGLNWIDLDYVNQKGVALRNARGVYSLPMAELALCGVLQLYKQTAFFRANQRAHIWEKRRGLRELAGSTVLILGCGSVGTACAERFAALGCRLVGVDLFPSPAAPYESVRPLAELDALLPEADVLLLTLPLTEQTRGLIDGRRLALLKPDAVLVNIARGPVVDEAALVSALRGGGLSGAVLDVFEQEPLQEDSPLWDMEQVVLTPHNSFSGSGSNARLTRTILENLAQYLSRA